MTAELEPFAQRLTALDTAFLTLEEGGAHMHVGVVCVFDGGPLATEGGGVNFPRIRDYVCGQLDAEPRYRQKLAFPPLVGHPYWVDDAHFNIGYHLRHTRIPAPGDDRQLKRLVGRVFGQRLDRAHPLWEMWIVEGLEGERFAVIAKAHHSMVDGVRGVGLLSALLRMSPDDLDFTPSKYVARPAPRPSELLRDELDHRVRGLGRAVPLLGRFRDTGPAVIDLLRTGTSPAAPTSLNPAHIGPHRRFDWVKVSLADVKKVRNGLGGKVNDVVLALVTEAVRRHHMRHGETNRPRRPYRAMLPVNTMAPGDGHALGNHVAMLLAELPIEEEDPRQRYARVVEETTYLKEHSDHAAAGDLIESLSDVTLDAFVAQIFRTATMTRPYNVVVTNVPGPPLPLYLLGAPLRALVPMVPLFGNQALGIAIFSYAGDLFLGLNADWEQVHDLWCFAEDVGIAMEELLEVAAS